MLVQDTSFLSEHPGVLLLIVLVAAWSLVWKGLALWRAGRNNQPVWFVILLIVNTLGILEIIYLMWFAKPAEPLKEQKTL